MTLSALLTKLRIKYFTATEIRKGAFIPKELVMNIAPTILYAEFMRTHLKFPITMTNSYRTWQHHVEIYLSMGYSIHQVPKHSLHLVFNALDLVPVSMSLQQLAEMHEFTKLPFNLYYTIEGRTRQFDNTDMGVGYYQNFVHIDTRGTLDRPSPSSWGTPIKS